MADECSHCYRPGFLAGELRADEAGQVTCSDCFDECIDEWLALRTLDELSEDQFALHEAMMDDRAHALAEMDAERRAGL